MNLKVDFKSSGGSMKADFGAVTQLARDRIEEYEKRIESLEKEKALAYESGLAAGKKLEYDTFWDAYQDNGALENYSYAFSGRGWNDTTFNPKYNISATTASNMFSFSQIGDLENLLKQNGVKLITHNATKTEAMFYHSTVTVIPELDISSSTDISYLFGSALNLDTIRLLRISQTGEQVFSPNTFYKCKSLKNLHIEGIIGSNIDLRYSPLSYDSIYNIIFCLSVDIEMYSKNAIFSKAAVNKAFETSPDANDGAESEAWSDLRKCRPMWNITCE